MKIKYYEKLNINGLRFPKVLTNYNNKNYILGSLKYNKINNKIKYLINCFELDNDFNIINNKLILDLSFIDKNYFNDINISSWLRDIGIENSNIYLLIELKYNIGEKLNSKFIKLHTLNFLTFKIIKEYNLGETDLLWLDYKNNIFKSDVTNTDIFKWGQYTFNFIINDKQITPIFDKYINNTNYQGQILHNIYSYNDESFDRIILSIRHKTEDYFKYKIYTSITTDYINFYNTEEIIFNNPLNEIQWLCYPFRFYFNNEYYLICNINDFGKNTSPVLFKIVEDN
jgi:hypothetical protein